MCFYSFQKITCPTSFVVTFWKKAVFKSSCIKIFNWFKDVSIWHPQTSKVKCLVTKVNGFFSHQLLLHTTLRYMFEGALGTPLWLLILSRWRYLLYRNQSIDLQSKSIDCFPYDWYIRHERVKQLIHTNLKI